jgi:hypothetical protein
MVGNRLLSVKVTLRFDLGIIRWSQRREEGEEELDAVAWWERLRQLNVQQ